MTLIIDYMSMRMAGSFELDGSWRGAGSVGRIIWATCVKVKQRAVVKSSSRFRRKQS